MKEWYGVRTFPGYETKVKEGLEKLIKKDDLSEQITDIFIPTYKRYTFVRNDIKLKEELVFPGYIFLKMNLTNELMYSVRGVQYITGYAGTRKNNKELDPITEEEIQVMVENTAVIESDLNNGQNVYVADFSGEKERVTIKEVDTLKKEILTKQGKIYSFKEISKK